MMAIAGYPLGITCIGLDPAPDACMGQVAEVIRGEFSDRSALASLADRCDVITVELEHVDVDALAAALQQITDLIILVDRCLALAIHHSHQAPKLVVKILRLISGEGPDAPHKSGWPPFIASPVFPSDREHHCGVDHLAVVR